MKSRRKYFTYKTLRDTSEIEQKIDATIKDMKENLVGIILTSLNKLMLKPQNFLKDIVKFHDKVSE